MVSPIPFGFIKILGAGTAYLADLVELFHGDLRLAMAAYNAGEQHLLARQLRYANKCVLVCKPGGYQIPSRVTAGR